MKPLAAFLLGVLLGAALVATATAAAPRSGQSTTLLLTPVDVSRPAERASTVPSRRPEWTGTLAPVASALPSPAPPATAAPHLVSGTASWYCLAGRSPCTAGHPGGLYAAAGPGLRVGDWRGRQVTVSAGGRSVTVTLIDWCACPGGRVVDLYAEAFARLAPLSRGVIAVEVTDDR